VGVKDKMTIKVCGICGAEIEEIKDGSNEIIQGYDNCEEKQDDFYHNR